MNKVDSLTLEISQLKIELEEKDEQIRLMDRALKFRKAQVQELKAKLKPKESLIDKFLDWINGR